MTPASLGIIPALPFPPMAELIGATPVILSLIIIEGLLSVDNALAIAAMARHLPAHQQQIALRWGLIGAYVFRGLCMALAAWIIENPWLKIGGALYLIYLMCKHFSERGKDPSQDPSAPQTTGHGLLKTIIAIEIMDLSLSVDNVVAAVAMSPKLWVVCTGVFIGILALRFVAGACIKLIGRFPVLEETAFLLIGYVGLILVYELLGDPHSGIQIFQGPVHVSSLQKFIGIFIIITLSILYSKAPDLKRVLGPCLNLMLIPMKLFSQIVTAITRMLLFPFVKIAGLFRKKHLEAALPGTPDL